MTTILLLTCFLFVLLSGRSLAFAYSQVGETEGTGDFIWNIVWPLAGSFFCGAVAFVVLLFIPSFNPGVTVYEAVWACITIFLPALLANQCAGWAKALKAPLSQKPVSEKRFGGSKTWGAWIYAPIGAVVAVAIQKQMPWFQSSLIDYGNNHLLVAVALLSGFGAVAGDQLESLLKRQYKISPGVPWWPWDQTDFAIGAGIPLAFVLGIGVINLLFGFMLLMVVVIHPIGNWIWYKLGQRERVL